MNARQEVHGLRAAADAELSDDRADVPPDGHLRNLEVEPECERLDTLSWAFADVLEWLGSEDPAPWTVEGLRVLDIELV